MIWVIIAHYLYDDLFVPLMVVSGGLHILWAVFLLLFRTAFASASFVSRMIWFFGVVSLTCGLVEFYFFVNQV